MESKCVDRACQCQSWMQHNPADLPSHTQEEEIAAEVAKRLQEKEVELAKAVDEKQQLFFHLEALREKFMGINTQYECTNVIWPRKK
jgi:hypothetical protein